MFFTRVSLSVRRPRAYIESMLSTLLVIALFAVIAGAVHVVDALGDEPRPDEPDVLRVDFTDRD